MVDGAAGIGLGLRYSWLRSRFVGAAEVLYVANKPGSWEMGFNEGRHESDLGHQRIGAALRECILG